MKHKKIFSISMVKNEMDIIESFVRYNTNILDGMIILDNGSTDNTVKVLKLLKNEGLPIFIFEDHDNEFNQAVKINQLLLKAVNEFNADIVVPLDADEFLISSNKENPREILEKIGHDSFYQVKWKTYMPNLDNNEQEKFIPAKLTFARYGAEEMHKVIIPNELVKNYMVKISSGNHNLIYNPKYKESIKPVLSTDLRIAHFPIRSREQITSKISVGWINELCNIKRTKRQSWHWHKMFDSLKKNGKIENGDIINFAKEYSSDSELSEIKIKEDPVNLSFCKNITLKYTNAEIDPFMNLIEKSEELSLDYSNFKKEALAKEKRLKTQIEDLKKEKLAERKQLKSKEKRLKREIQKYQSSTSWKVTSPLRKISTVLRDLRD